MKDPVTWFMDLHWSAKGLIIWFVVMGLICVFLFFVIGERQEEQDRKILAGCKPATVDNDGMVTSYYNCD